MWAGCSVTLEKERDPFFGKTIFSGTATNKMGKKGGTEQLSQGYRAGLCTCGQEALVEERRKDQAQRQDLQDADRVGIPPSPMQVQLASQRS